MIEEKCQSIRSYIIFVTSLRKNFCNQWFSFPVSNKYIYDVWRMILYIITIPNEATSFDSTFNTYSLIYHLIEFFVLSSFWNFKRKNNQTNSNALFDLPWINQNFQLKKLDGPGFVHACRILTKDLNDAGHSKISSKSIELIISIFHTLIHWSILPLKIASIQPNVILSSSEQLNSARCFLLASPLHHENSK